MSFVSLGGTEASRPTFFELVAAERLMPSLKAAAVYSLSVFGQHRAWVFKLLEYEDELFAALTAFLDYGSLSDGSSTFAESLYSLRRAPAEGTAATQLAAHEKGESSAMLSSRQKRSALFLAVVLPYLNSKATALFMRHRSQPAALPGLAAFDQQRQQRSPGEPTDAAAQQLSWADRTTGLPTSLHDLRQRLRAHLHTLLNTDSRSRLAWRLKQYLFSAFMQVYPIFYAVQESCKAGLQVAYLVGRTPHDSPPLWLLGQRVVRVSPSERAEAEVHRRQERQQALSDAVSRGNFLQKVFQQAWLRGGYLLADHTRNALIISVFAYKALEWWYTSAEGKLAGQSVLLPPPPPPQPPCHPQGLSLPEDPSDCAICIQQRTNSAIVDISGFAFCYPCIFRYIETNGCCPVTRRPARQDNIRRVFPNT